MRQSAAAGWIWVFAFVAFALPFSQLPAFERVHEYNSNGIHLYALDIPRLQFWVPLFADVTVVLLYMAYWMIKRYVQSGR
jgi:hypothetical protein